MKGLKEGFTTGTCATAASMAAVELAANGILPSKVLVPLPPFRDGSPTSFMPVKASSGSRDIPPAYKIEGIGDPLAYAGVVKDGGDDPDATNGAVIVATLYAVKDPKSLDTNAGREGSILLHGGFGVGVVTRPGLPVDVGEAAINPVPRQQIHFALRSMKSALAGLTAPLAVVISVPDGEKLARNTLNSRLGIIGGISILGTHGIVKPFSSEAWMETVKSCLRIADPSLPIILSTGRRSEKALMTLYPELPRQSFIQAGDLVAFSLAEAAKKAPINIIWGAFFGKLVKMAQGLPDTRASRGELDLGWLASLHTSRDPEIAKEIAEVASARRALEALQSSPRGEETIMEILRLAKSRARGWAGREVAIHLFHENGEELARL